jgi:hypothetical protein
VQELSFAEASAGTGGFEFAVYYRECGFELFTLGKQEADARKIGVDLARGVGA